MKQISSRHNPVVQTFRTLGAGADASGRLLLDGAHLVRDARAAGVPLEIVAVSASRLGRPSEEGRLALELEHAGVCVIEATEQVFDAMSPVRSPSGIVAIARLEPAAVADICRLPQAFVVAAVDVQDPGNVGALLRTAEAGGATGAIICGHSSSPFSWKAVRGSMGSVLRLPVATGLTGGQALAAMQAAGVRAVAAVPRGGADPDAIDWTGSVGLLIGGEGQGLDDRLAAACDVRVTIPMAASVESLNAGAAAAVLIYAARRQRS